MEGEVAGEGFGDTAKLAQREAARFVLDKLELSPVPGADLQTKPPKVEDMIAGMFQVDIDMLSHDISLISLLFFQLVISFSFYSSCLSFLLDFTPPLHFGLISHFGHNRSRVRVGRGSN